MNDRFKFRTWDKGNEHYVDCADLLYIEPSGQITYGCYDGDREDMYYYEQDDVVIEQCTGLKDKNGKLIFEGDIVRWSLCRGDGDVCENYQIVWQDNCAAFGCLKSNGDILDMFSQSELKAKVIGNIHENPELLEQSNDD